MTEELKQEAENFIIDRYKLNECYREDNEETRGYMRTDVHSQYEEEYQLYLAGATEATKELQEENKVLENRLKKQMRCAGCIHSDSPCIPADYEEDEEGFCINYLSLFGEFEKLKKKLEQAEKVKVVEHFEAYGQCRDSRQIANLEAQIEKMKCCGNCRWEYPSSSCDYCKRLEGQIFADTLTSDNWELAE